MPSPFPSVYPDVPAFNLHAIIKASVRAATGAIDIERIRKEAAPSFARVLTATKRVDHRQYSRVFLRKQDSTHDYGNVADLLIVTAGRRPVVKTVSFDFSLPKSSYSREDVSITARVQMCPKHCYEGDWFAGIGMLETGTTDGQIGRFAADAAKGQRQRTPNDPGRIAAATVEAMVKLTGGGPVALPVHLFDVGLRVRNLTNVPPCN